MSSSRVPASLDDWKEDIEAMIKKKKDENETEKEGRITS